MFHCMSAGLCAGRVSSIPTLHVDPDQPDPRSDPNSNSNPNPNPLEGSWSAGAVTRLPPRVLVTFF